jgi:hypothetical protein
LTSGLVAPRAAVLSVLSDIKTSYSPEGAGTPGDLTIAGFRYLASVAVGGL